MFINELQQDKNKIFFLNQCVKTQFSEEQQDGLFAVEDSSWWFQYRAKVIGAFAEKYFSPYERTFDVGGGNGYTTAQISNRGFKMGLIEPSYAACLHAQKRGIDMVVCGSVDDTFPEGCFSQVMMLDVLEHIEDDKSFLNTLYKLMESEGHVLLTVPALENLWSSEDVAAGHFRRYTKELLTNRLEAAGFKIMYINYFFSFLVVPIYLVRVWGERIGVIRRAGDRTQAEQQRLMKQQFEKRKGVVQSVLECFENIEYDKLLQNKEMMCGSSIICVAKK